MVIFFSFFYPIDPSPRFGEKKKIINSPHAVLRHRNDLPLILLWDFQNVI